MSKNWNNINADVYAAGCEDYASEHINFAVNELFSNIDVESFKGKNVVIKPNLLLKATPERAITTHPSVISAIVENIKKYEPSSITIAESSGGPYTDVWINPIYASTGIKALSQSLDVNLNRDFGFSELHDAENKYLKTFNVINPIYNADVVINISKLKSHALTLMSGAVKNLFGTVPGIQKFEMHARFPDHTDFANAVLDITSAIHRAKTVYDFTDAVICLEGNGPSTSGTPRKVGYIAMSENPFALDILNEHMIGFDGNTEMLSLAAERGYCKRSFSELNVHGDIEGKRVTDFKLPDSHKLSYLRNIPSFLAPKPLVNPKICKGCGECAKSCPEKTIEIKNKIAHISRDKCIRCFCCQELCPFHAIEIKENVAYKIIGALERIF